MDLEYVDLKLEDLLEYIQKNNTNENHTYYYNKIVELKKDINEDKIDNDIFLELDIENRLDCLIKEITTFVNKNMSRESIYLMNKMKMTRNDIIFRC